MSVSDLALIYQLVRDIPNGFTVLQDYDGSGNLLYEGMALTWTADPAATIWWITKYTLVAGSSEQSKYQYSPPNQIWNNRTTIFP